MPVDDTVDIDETDDAATLASVAQDGPDDAPTDDAEPADAPDDAPADDAPAPVAEAAPEPPAPDPVEPFAFNAFKQRYEVPGLAFNPKTHTITAEGPQAVQRLQQLLSHGREWEARGRQELVQTRRELQQVKETGSAETEAAKAYLSEWEKLMAMHPDDVAAYVVHAQASWPKIQAEATLKHAQQVLEQVKTAQQPPEPDVDAVVEDARSGAAELVQEFLQDQPWATPAVREKVTAFLQDIGTMNRWVARATRDMPEHGIRAGQYVAVWDDARALLDQYVAPYRDAHAQFATHQTAAAKQIQQTQTVAAQNAKALAQAKPVVRTPPRVASVVADDAPKLTTQEIRAKIDRDMDRAWEDQRRRR